MIIVKLMGGLGNQMFQYALGQVLAQKNKVLLKMDLTFLNDRNPAYAHTFRNYALDVFAASPAIATEKEIGKIKKIGATPFYKILNVCVPGIFPNRFYKEKDFAYDSHVFDLKDSAYLDGFWQSYKYFSNAKNLINNCFTFKDPLSEKNEDLARQIRTCNSVSLHVRRGDYASNPSALKHHGTCDVEYYQKAIDLIALKTSYPHLFIFSDDINWVQENLNIGLPATYVSHNVGDKSFEDMRLMSLCKHAIVANSSFSWWGAWLIKAADPVIVAPQKWFADPGVNTQDLCPENWIRI